LAAVCGPAMFGLLSQIADAASHYSMDDFARVDKIDAHVHLDGGAADVLIAEAEHDRFRLLTINVDAPHFPIIEQQERDAVALCKRYPGKVAFAATFSVKDFKSPEWAIVQLRGLSDALAQGAVGAKIWKNIGLALQDSDGRYVMVDDLRLQPIFDRLERDNIVVLGHQSWCWGIRESREISGDLPIR
jgi:hypothetical protein